jgi:flagellar motility protein MotE (MotC chaperone)
MEPNRKTTEGQVMGIIGIVMGVISLIVAFIPCVGIVAFLPGGLAIIFSIISIVQATKGNGAKGLGIASLVVSSLAILLAATWLIVFSGVSMIANEAINEPEKFEKLEKGIREAFESDFEEEISKPRIDSLENKLRELESKSAQEIKKVEDEIKAAKEEVEKEKQKIESELKDNS